MFHKWRILSVVFVTAIVHCTIIWPQFLEPTTSLHGWPGDNLFFCWNLWWVSQCLTGEFSQSSLFCPVGFYPHGVDFVFHTHTWLYGVFYSVLQTLTGGNGPNPIFAYNLLTLISSILSGLALASLCRLYEIKSFPALCVAALVGTFTNFRVFSFFGHLNFIGTEFFLWSVYAYTRAILRDREEGYCWWMIGGMLTGLCWLNDITLGMFSFLFLGWCMLWKLYTEKTFRLHLVYFLLALLGCTILALPHWIHLKNVYLSGDYVVASYDQVRACDVLNMVIPSNYQAYLGPWWRLYREKMGIYSGGEGTAFLGWASLLTLIVVLSQFSFKRWIKSPIVRFWLPVALFGLFLVPGEWFSLAGHRIVPLPLRAMRWIPFFNNLRVPPRFIIFFFVPMALLTGYFVQYLLHEKRFKLGLVFVVGWITLFTMDVSYTQMVNMTVGKDGLHLPEQILKEISVDKLSVEQGAVWYIPSSFHHHYEATWYQTQHKRPTVFGTNARLSPQVSHQWMNEGPFLQGMIKGQNPGYNHLLQVVPDRDERIRQLSSFIAAHHVEYIITDNQMMEDATRYVQDHCSDCQLIYSDERYGLFQVKN